MLVVDNLDADLRGYLKFFIIVQVANLDED
jgi:uncharacterized protein Smg (DUF494 family)